ncbi:MAG: hypothetical protein ABWX85_06750, partial [Arthrobacter sp.]
LRDGKCPFPGCGNHSLDTEADHLLAWADGGTTGIANLGQPCPKHHRLKHSSAWTPTPASKDSPPGWTSPSGRYYPSEHQDWEPPAWPDHMAEETVTDNAPSAGPPQEQGPPADPARPPGPAFHRHPGRDLGLDPGQDPGLELPTDPFPDWHLFTAAHPLPAADTDDQEWTVSPKALKDECITAAPYPGDLLRVSG